MDECVRVCLWQRYEIESNRIASHRICLQYSFIESVLIHNKIRTFPSKTSIKCVSVLVDVCIVQSDKQTDRQVVAACFHLMRLSVKETNQYVYCILYQGKTSNFRRKQNRRELYLSIGRSVGRSVYQSFSRSNDRCCCQHYVHFFSLVFLYWFFIRRCKSRDIKM